MTTDPDQIRARIDALLAEVPETLERGAGGIDIGDLDAVGARLDEAHDILVQALESVEKG